MKQLTLLQRFSLLSLVSLVAVNLVLGWTITTALYTHALDGAKALTAKIVLSETRNEFSPEELVAPKDGSEFPVEAALSAVSTDKGVLVLASVVDITERRRVERTTIRQRDELAHLSRVAMLGELSGSLAHELNQPLSVIKTASSFIISSASLANWKNSHGLTM